MAVTGKFAADFDDFYDAVQTAEAHLRSFETNSAKVETRLNAVTDAFSGRRIVQEATIAVKAVQEIGGVTALTAGEQDKLNRLLGDAITKYGAMGKTADDEMTAMYDATKKVEEPTGAISTSIIAVGTTIGTMASNAVTALAQLAVDGIGKVASGFADLVMEGANVSSISGNFDRLASAAGGVAATMLGTLREGTHGTIADLDLMRVANEQMAAGLRLSDGDMRTLASGAFTLAQATGKDVKTALQEMSGALISGQVKVEGLTDAKINAEAVEIKYALSLGKTREQLTPDEALYAHRQTLLDAVATATGRVGEQTDGIGEKVQQAAAKWDNFRSKLAMSIADSPVLVAGFDAIMTSLEQAFGGSQEALIAAIADAINKAAIIAVDFGINVVELARSGIEAWGTLKTPIDLITVAILEVVSKTAEGIASMLELAAAAPGVGSAFETQAGAARAVATEYGAMTVKAHEQLAADRELATGQGAVHKGLDLTVAALGSAKSAMEASSLASTAAGTAIDGHAAASRGQAGATAAATTNTNADVDALRKQEQALKDAKDAEKKMQAAMAELQSVGTDWRTTISGMDAGVVSMAEAYIRAGADAGALKTALGLTDGQMKALTESVKAQDKAVEQSIKWQQEWAKAQVAAATEARTLWDEYEKIRGQQTKTATDQQIAEVERWKQNLITKHQEAGDLTDDLYRAIEANAAAKLDQIKVDWQGLTTASQTNLQQTADKALATYNEAREGHHNLTLAQIDNLERIAIAAQDSANGYATSFTDAATTVSGAMNTAADESVAAIGRVTAAGAGAAAAAAGVAGAVTPRLDQITGVYQSAGSRSMSGATGSFASTSLVGVARSQWDAKAREAGGSVMYDTYNNPYIYIPGVNSSSGKTSPDAYGARSAGGWEDLYSPAPPGRAAGGPVSAGEAYMVGERGPEIFVPRTDGHIATGAGTSISVVVQVSGAILGTANDLARLVGDAMIGRLRQQGVQLPASV